MTPDRGQSEARERGLMEMEITMWPTDDSLNAAYGRLEEPVDADPEELEVIYQQSLRRAMHLDPIIQAAIAVRDADGKTAGPRLGALGRLIDAVDKAGL